MKKKIVNLIKNSIVSAVFGTLFGILITSVVQSIYDKIPFDPIWIVVVCSLMITCLVFLIVFRIDTIKEYNDHIISDVVDSFVTIDKEQISSFATSMVKKASFIRVLGTARQDVVDSVHNDATTYLSALEKRMSSKPSDESKIFKYFRVVPTTAKSSLSQHIKICNENAQKTGNIFSICEIPSFDFYISYQIFDNNDLLLIVDNKSHDKKQDNALCLWTRNKKIIDVFIKRFDDAWKSKI